MRIFVALAIFEGCPPAWLDNVASVRAALESAVEAGGFTLLDLVARPFSPHGVTACAVVGESHLALHTWPEEGRLFVDIASCSSQEGVRRALDAIAAAVPEGKIATLDERVLDPSSARSLTT